MAKVTIFVFFFFSLSEFTVRANEFAKADKTFENSLFAKLAGSVTANRKHLTFDPDISRTPIAIQELLRYKEQNVSAEINAHVLVKRNVENSSENQQNLALSIWQAWTSCDVTQCNANGTQQRFRRCFIDGNESENRTECQTNLSEQRSCTRTCGEEQKNFSQWTEWTSWSSCSVSCGLGAQRRQRDCDHSPGGFCIGSPNESRACHANYTCPFFTPWSEWSQCSKTCGYDGYRHRNKSCVQRRVRTLAQQSNEVLKQATVNENSTRVVSIDLCDENERSWDAEPCPEQEMCDFTWSEWGNWGQCSVNCGSGFQISERYCLSGECVGYDWRYRECSRPPCWSQWSDYSDCSRSCGTQRGLQSRSRTCLGKGLDNQFANETCEGEKIEQRNCSDKACPSWTRWSRFGLCSQSCGGGTRTRHRQCLVDGCSGTSVQAISCNRHRCPVWSEWSPFSCCSVSCGENGTKNRTRTCLYDHFGRGECTGNAVETIPCTYRPCNITLPSVFDTFECGMRRNARNRPALRIIQGQESIPHGWPWQASWQEKLCARCPWVHRCGATLVAPQWLVIAGHCIEESFYRIDPYNPGERVSVVLGMHRLQRDGERHFLSRVFVHRNYSFEIVTEADIALLRLRNPVELSSNISPICLPDATPPAPSDSCYITGWGHTETPSNLGSRLSPVLMEAEIPILDFESCQNLGDLYRTYLSPTDHFCAGNTNSTSVDSCQGDSGGPLACSKENNRYYLSGVTSFGFFECGIAGHVGIYTPVHLFEPWIRKTIQYFSYDSC